MVTSQRFGFLDAFSKLIDMRIQLAMQIDNGFIAAAVNPTYQQSIV
jgi:hypothetical protein